MNRFDSKKVNPNPNPKRQDGEVESLPGLFLIVVTANAQERTATVP
jgi:hypothetical protein